MPAAKRTTTKKAATRAKPKSAKNASAKNVKRATRVAKNASTTATRETKKTTQNYALQSDAVLKQGAETLRTMMSQLSSGMGGDNVQRQLMNASQESAAQLAKSADACQKSMSEMFSLSKDNVDAAVTCSSIAVNASKSMGAELFNYANKSFSQNVEMSKELFGCRTINDMFDLQSKVVKTNLDHFFNESVKMSEMMFKCANEVSEPLNKRVSENAKRISKAVSEAA